MQKNKVSAGTTRSTEQAAPNTDAALDLAAEFVCRAADFFNAYVSPELLNDVGKNAAQQGPLWGGEWLDGTDRTVNARDQVIYFADIFARYANNSINTPSDADTPEGQARVSWMGHQIRACVPFEARNGAVAQLFQDTAPEAHKLFADAMSQKMH